MRHSHREIGKIEPWMRAGEAIPQGSQPCEISAYRIEIFIIRRHGHQAAKLERLEIRQEFQELIQLGRIRIKTRFGLLMTELDFQKDRETVFQVGSSLVETLGEPAR